MNLLEYMTLLAASKAEIDRRFDEDLRAVIGAYNENWYRADNPRDLETDPEVNRICDRWRDRMERYTRPLP